MKIQKNNLIIIVSLFLSIMFSSYVWDLIKLPYKEVDIIGVYAENEYNAFNEILRYLFFILFPLIIFLSLQIHFNKFSFKNLIPQLQINQNIIYENNQTIRLTKIVIFAFIFAEFFSVDFTTIPLDLFHEGQRLSSAYKSLIDNSLWSGSYVTVGLFYETLSAKLIWQLFDHESIGLMRFADRIFILFCKILIVLIIYKIALFSKLKFFYKEIFFIICSLILIINLFDYHTQRNDAEYLLFRELPILLTTYLFFEIISKKDSNKLLILLFGPISFFSMLWSIDRGLICNVLVFSILIYFLITQKFKDGIVIFFSIFFSWLLAIFFLGNEFKFFLDNTFTLLKEINYVFGEIHVTPFGSGNDSFRAGKILIAIIFCLIISLNFFIQNNKNYSTQFKLSMLFLSIVSFLTYGYNLGRSGEVHLKEVFGYSIIFFVILIVGYFLQILSNKKLFFKKYTSRNSIFLLIFVTCIFTLSLNVNPSKILKFNKRFIQYINLEDQFYLDKAENSFLKDSNDIVKDYNCIQMFTNEIAYLYLLRKKNCTK
ncbi:MAG: hypothetical protein H8E55_59900 [Pelagibacterales bacterium]|nr:hypothetical protein [Pelagibacterales bacterium]